MPFVSTRQALKLLAEERARLEDLSRSRSAEKRQVVHAAILLDCANGMSDNAIAHARGVDRHTVALCVRKFLQFGIDAALGELPRPGKIRSIPEDPLPGCKTALAGSQRTLDTLRSCGPMLCCRTTCASMARPPSIQVWPN